MMAVIGHIEKNGLTQAQAAKQFGVTQPRISEMLGLVNAWKCVRESGAPFKRSGTQSYARVCKR